MSCLVFPPSITTNLSFCGKYSSIKFFVLSIHSFGEDTIILSSSSRIFVSEKLIEDSIKYAIEVGAASAVIPATDVIFESKEDGKLTDVPLRKYLCHAQTPQSFNIDKFLEIYEDLSDEEIAKLDVAMVLFHLRNADIKLFPGNQGNFKITRPFDIIMAEAIFKK